MSSSNDVVDFGYPFADLLFSDHPTEDTLRRATLLLWTLMPDSANVKQCSLFLKEQQGIYREIVSIKGGQIFLDTNFIAEGQLPAGWPETKDIFTLVSGASCEVWIPFHSQELIGFMVWLCREAPEGLSDEEVLRFQRIATLGIRHFVALEDTRRRVRMLQATADLAHLISATKSTETILFDLVKAGVNVLGFDRATLFLYEGDGKSVSRAIFYVLGAAMPIELSPPPKPPTLSEGSTYLPDVHGIWVPITVDGQRLAGIFLDNLYSHEEAPEGALKAVSDVCSQVGLVLQRMHLLEALNQKATLDDLTGLHRVNSFYEEGNRILEAAMLESKPTGLIIVDLDHFKEVNDSYGHPIGDAVLMQTASIIQANLPEGAIAGRIGGDEFVILLPTFNMSQSRRFAKHLLHEYTNANFSFLMPSTQRLTLSIGVTSGPEQGQSISELMQVADKALYRSKRNGRAKVSTTAGTA